MHARTARRSSLSLRSARGTILEDKDPEVPVDVFFVRKSQTLVPPEEAKTAAQLLEECSSSEDEELLQPPRLMLTSGAEQPQPSAAPSILDPTVVWEWRAKNEAVIIVAEVGARPGRLAYIRCHRETRRQLLLQSRVKEQFCQPCMQHVVRVAMRLVKDGSMPGPGEHGRRNEFVKRCAAALRVLDPSKETDLKKLGAQDQALIRQALGGDISTPYEGCLSADCLDEETIWETSNNALPGEPFAPISRCSRCEYPKAFGRSVNSVHDILLPTMERLRAFTREPVTSRMA